MKYGFTKNFFMYSLMAIAVLLLPVFIYPQQAAAPDYRADFNAGNYVKAVEKINKILEDYYSKRVDNKRVPIPYISMKAAAKTVDLKMLFRNRRAEHFFIEDNPEISGLHVYAARCYFKLANLDYSLNHYIQALRYKKVEEKKDDVLYYEMAQVFLKGKFFNAYVNYLEAASALNRDNYSYSLELGRALYRTDKKKTAIFHLERYINAHEESASPELYLMLGNLYEDIAKYLETEKCYIKYLEKKPDDGYIHFALGHIQYLRTGNYPRAIKSLDRALQLLPEKEFFRRSKAYEYKADIIFQELDFESAVQNYSETIRYQNAVADTIKNKQAEIESLTAAIRELKASLLRVEDFEKYEQYENLLDKKGKRETELKQMKSEYDKLNAGKVRWNIAYSLERLEKLNDAIGYYRQCIAFDYNANQARKKIINLELKIKRGY